MCASSNSRSGNVSRFYLKKDFKKWNFRTISCKPSNNWLLYLARVIKFLYTLTDINVTSVVMVKISVKINLLSYGVRLRFECWHCRASKNSSMSICTRSKRIVTRNTSKIMDFQLRTKQVFKSVQNLIFQIDGEKGSDTKFIIVQ